MAKICKVCFSGAITHQKHMLCSAARSSSALLSFFSPSRSLSDSRAWMVNEFCSLCSASPPGLQPPNASPSQFLVLSPLTQTMGRYATRRRSSSPLHSHRLCLTCHRLTALTPAGHVFLLTGTSCGLTGSLGSGSSALSSNTKHLLGFKTI